MQDQVIQPGGGCFTADTPVATPDGFKPIGEVRVGDRVLAFDHGAGTWSARRVEAVHEKLYEDSLVTVHTDGGEAFQATIHHPVWVVSGRGLDERARSIELEPHEDEGGRLAGRWVDSHLLRPGDVLVARDGGLRTVLRTEQEFVSSRHVVNLTVEADHTYAVGESGLLVHNTPCPEPVAADVAPKIRNGHLAGKAHPKTGIPFDKNGFPDFSSVSKADVKIQATGNRAADFRAANKAAGYKRTPEGFTWHHHQDGTTMQLVPTDIHRATGHTGGFSLGQP